ncbi:MAG: 30S ribosomal protein S18 [Patescibacteria group bacterium]
MATTIKKEKRCYFCENNITQIDYKDTQTMKKFMNYYSKILPRRRTGICSAHQRKLSLAVKRARIMALIPFTAR